jgi:hypothetical protein
MIIQSFKKSLVFCFAYFLSTFAQPSYLLFDFEVGKNSEGLYVMPSHAADQLDDKCKVKYPLKLFEKWMLCLNGHPEKFYVNYEDGIAFNLLNPLKEGHDLMPLLIAENNKWSPRIQQFVIKNARIYLKRRDGDFDVSTFLLNELKKQLVLNQAVVHFPNGEEYCISKQPDYSRLLIQGFDDRAQVLISNVISRTDHNEYLTILQPLGSTDRMRVVLIVMSTELYCKLKYIK